MKWKMPGKKLGMAVGASAALAGCAAPVVVEDHADSRIRMATIAHRIDADVKRGGMMAVIEDTQGCYALATRPFVRVFALRDCLVMDYVGYRMDVAVGRDRFGSALPYYEDAAATTRWAPYAQLAQFQQPGEFVGYMNDCNTLVQRELAALNPPSPYAKVGRAKQRPRT